MVIKKTFSQGTLIFGTSILGIGSGFYVAHSLIFADILLGLANNCSKIFINLLQLMCIPIIFLSIVSTLANMDSLNEMKILGKKAVKYTLLTTLIAATLALILFILIDPARIATVFADQGATAINHGKGYLEFMLDIIPSNIIKTLGDNSKVISVVFIAALFGFATLSTPTEHKKTLQNLFASLFAVVLQITKLVIIGMPLAVWAFTTIFIKDLMHQDITSLALYITCILLANILQGIIVLPILLKIKKIPVLSTLKGMSHALVVAFFSKSSNATLPVTLRAAQTNLKVSPRVANFVLPLCTVINMNGCAAFILITVLFVATLGGMSFSPFDMIIWIFLASIAAIGNAGVPMGCFFLTSAFLVSMNLPSSHLQILGVILPFYSIIDMVETALNVWSDSCVTVIIDKEIREENEVENF